MPGAVVPPCRWRCLELARNGDNHSRARCWPVPQTSTLRRRCSPVEEDRGIDALPPITRRVWGASAALPYPRSAHPLDLDETK